MKPRTSENFRSKKIVFGKKDTYVPPEEDVETWSFDKMLQCWELRDKACFWENVMWLVDNKQDTQKYYIEFNTLWQPDLQGDPGSNTRCVTSDQPMKKWWAVEDGSIPNPFNREPSEIRCIDVVGKAGFINRMEQDCASKCQRLAQGETCTNRNTSEMGFEQAGCDGKTVYCWCNSDNTYKKR